MGTDGVYASWQENQSTGSAFTQRFNSSGKRQWSDLGLAIAIGDTDSPRLVPCGEDNYITVWRESTTTGITILSRRFSASGNGAQNLKVIIHSASSALYLQNAVPDGNNGVVIVWTTADRALMAQRISRNGEVLWSTDGEFVAQLPRYARISVSPDGAGGAFINWDNFITRDSLADRHSYVQHVDGNGNSQFGPDEMQVSGESINQCSAVCAPDGSGGAFRVWYDRRSSPTLGWNVFSQRLSANGERLWGEEDVQITTSTGRVNLYPPPIDPSIVTDGAGGALVAWGDLRNGSVSDIFIQRLSAGGICLWEDGGAAVYADLQANQVATPLVVAAGSGGAIVMWRTGSDRIPQQLMAQRFSADGSRMWGPNGVVVASTYNNLYFVEDPQMISDGAGGAYITWTGSSIGSGNFVAYITRVYTNGTLSPPALIDGWRSY